MLAHLACTRSSRSALATPGPYIAIAICTAIVSPHLLWLFRNGFPTLHYAVGRAGSAADVGDRLLSPFKFLAAQAVDIAPAFVVSAIAGLLAPDRAGVRHDESLRYLLWLTLGPPALVFVLSLVTALGIRDMWGTPMWNLVGLALVRSAVARWQTASLPRLGVCVTGLFAIGLAGYQLANVWVPEFQNRPSRIQWPDGELSRSFAAIWRERTGRPLRIVAADGWLGGLVAMGTEPRPSVWIDASYVKAPWITPEKVAQEGVLVLWRLRSQELPPPELASLHGLTISGVKSFNWPRTPDAQPLRIGYGIVLPERAKR
jgi:hypothetical protein